MRLILADAERPHHIRDRDIHNRAGDHHDKGGDHARRHDQRDIGSAVSGEEIVDGFNAHAEGFRCPSNQAGIMAKRKLIASTRKPS